MASHNDITGDALVSRVSNSKYAEGYDRVFGKKKEKQNAGTNADGDTVSVPPVPSAGCTGQASESGSDNTEGSTA